MNISDLEPTPPTIDPTPRPRAAQHTRRPLPEPGPGTPTFTIKPAHLLAAAISVIFFAGLIILASQFSGQPIKAQPTATAQPTEEPAHTFFAPPTTAPAPPQATEAPIPTIAPADAPAPVLAAPVDPPPMTGQGMTLTQDQAAVEAAPVDQYIQNVGAQAEHCIRNCDGQHGPSGGDWVVVPTLAPEYAQTIGQQAPHKVR